MENFQLSIFFKIKGIGSASGLVYHNDLLYVISDNSTYLYKYDPSAEKLNKIALVENPQDNIPKKEKPDFEAITNNEGVLYIMGSGSTAYRNRSFIYNIENQNIEEKDLKDYFQEIKSQLYISDEEFNIEGCLFHKDQQFLFQRGNGATGKNGIICVSGIGKIPKATFIPFDLPSINNVRATFTDAVLLDGKIFFLASAEATASTYEDGEILGSIIGSIDLKQMKLENYLQISDRHKFEGLAFYRKTASQIEFLLCEDADSEVLETTIYHLTIKD